MLLLKFAEPPPPLMVQRGDWKPSLNANALIHYSPIVLAPPFFILQRCKQKSDRIKRQIKKLIKLNSR
jgi:hypothetical protein